MTKQLIEASFNLSYLIKGIGLPLEESLKFWKNEFSKGTIPVDKAS